MGPKRKGDPAAPLEPAKDLETLHLGVTDTTVGPAEGGPAANTEQHWLAGLLRADALAIASAVLLMVTVVGSPAIRLVFPYGLLMELGALWIFVPILVGAVIATVLGLVSVRQAARQAAPGWVRAIGGAATLAAVAIALGTAVTWVYMAESGALEAFRGFF